MITPSSTLAGGVAIAMPEAYGVAEVYASGLYTGDEDLLYTIKIDSIAGGQDIGQATFCWRRFDSTSEWEDDGILTSGTPISLDNGLSVRFIAGTGGNQFELGDTFKFFGTRLRGRAKLVDQDPNSYWEAIGNTSENLTIDLGAAQLVDAFWIGNHNLSASATVTLMAHTSDSWGSPAYSQALTITTPHILLFPGETYQYWRLVMADAGNANNIRVGGLYMGGYWEPERDFRRGYKKSKVFPLRGKQPIGPAFDQYSINYGSATEAAQAGLQALMAAVYDTDTLRRAPCIFCPDAAAPGVSMLGFPPAELEMRQQHLERFNVPMSFEELPRKAW